MKVIKMIITKILIASVCLTLAGCTGLHPGTDGPGTTGPDDTTTTTTAQTEITAETEDPTMDIDGFGLVGDDGEGEGAVDNTSGLKRFYYSYNGTIGGNNYYYNVTEEDDGKVVFECDFMEFYDYGTMTKEVDRKVLEDLYQLYLDHRVQCWNGYSKYAEGVDDGDGFSLEMDFEDGQDLYVYGSNCAPEGFYEFKKDMEAILSPIADELKEEKRQEIMNTEIEGDLSSFLVTFTGRGDSGSDKYEFFVLRNGHREKNFDVQIQSDSGEFFEEGKYSWYCALPDEAIDFDGVKALIEKYDLIKWYNWDKSAEDYNNSEWFQVSFGFDNITINAMGTAHPENYDEFRKEFLELMAGMIEKAEKEYGLEKYK